MVEDRPLASSPLTRIHAEERTHARAHTVNTHTHTHTRTHARTHARTSTHKRARAHTSTHPHTCTHIDTHTRTTETHTRTHNHNHIHIHPHTQENVQPLKTKGRNTKKLQRVFGGAPPSRGGRGDTCNLLSFQHATKRRPYWS